MTREMQEKIQMIDEYISKAKEIEVSKNIDEAERYAKHVLGIYSAEIPGLKDNLARFEWKFGDERTDYLFDV